MSTLVETAPRTIWLCVSDDEDDNDKPYPELYAEDAEITWSTDQPVAVTVEYARADIAAADLAAARAESDLAHWLLRNARKYMNPMHEALCAAIDNVLQKKQAALAGKDAT